METRFSVSVGRGFGTRGGLVDLAEGLRIREEDWHTRSMSHKRQLMPWGKERSRGGQEPPREGDASRPARGPQVAGGCLFLWPAYSPCDALTGQDTARVLQAQEDMGGRSDGT